MNKFAERLKDILQEKGISQNQFAKNLKIGQKTVNNWCLGNHEPCLDMIIIICKELGESSDYLIGMID